MRPNNKPTLALWSRIFLFGITCFLQFDQQAFIFHKQSLWDSNPFFRGTCRGFRKVLIFGFQLYNYKWWDMSYQLEMEEHHCSFWASADLTFAFTDQMPHIIRETGSETITALQQPPYFTSCSTCSLIAWSGFSFISSHVRESFGMQCCDLYFEKHI